MKQTITFYCVMLVCFTSLLNAQSVKTNISNSNSQQISFNVELENASTESATGSIKINSVGPKLEVGKPDLPCQSNWIIIPRGTTPKIIITEGTPVIYKNVEVSPVQEGEPEIDDFVPVFNKDKVTYSTNAFYPGKFASLDPVKSIKGVNGTIFWIYPYQYNPVTKVLKVYPNLKVDVIFEGEEHDRSMPSSSITNNPLLNIAVNSREILGSTAEVARESSDADTIYLIITHPDFKAAADKLAEWKNSIGILTKVVSTTTIGNSPSAEDIETYIDNAIDSWCPSLSYLLLMGDADFVPTFYKAMHPYHNIYTGTDVYYADLDNDLGGILELACGRMPVSTNTEAMTMVSRVIQHEKNPQNEEFFNKVACAGYFQHAGDGYAQRRFAKTSEDIRNSLVGNGFDVERLYVTGSSVNPTNWTRSSYIIFENDGAGGLPVPAQLRKPTFAWDANSTDVINAVNDGVFLLTHRDHGSRELWGDPHFNISNIRSLNNGNKRPIVWSINCMTGWFDNETDNYSSSTTDCFSEEWVNHSTGGAVGVIAATRVSYSGKNDRFAWGLTDAIWPGFINSNGGSYGGASNPSINRMGDVLNYAKAYMSSMYSSSDNIRKLTMELFHYFGDPTMEIFPKCVESKVITEDYAGETIYHSANDYIIANNTISSSSGTASNVTYNAGNSVQLTTGFKVEQGSKFLAYLEGCTPQRDFESAADPIARNYKNTPQPMEELNTKDAISKPQSIESTLKVYPNPSSGSFTVSLGQEVDQGSIVVTDLGGKLIYSQSINNNSEQIDLFSQEKGMYLIKIITNTGTTIRKIIIH